MEEPLVNLGHLPDLVHTVTSVHSVGNGKETLVRWGLELIIDRHQSLGLAKAKIVEVDGANSFLDSLLERSSNAHDLTDTLHRGSELGGDTGELLQIPAGHLHDDVIKRGLEAGACHLCHGVLDLLERDTETQLSSDEGQGITGGLGRQGRRPGQSGVDLDDAVLLGEGIERILDVAFADNAQMTDDIDCGRAKHVVILVRERLRRGDDDGISGVNTEGIEVFHVTDRDAVVLGIANNFIFNFFPALHAALNEHLRAGGQGLVAEVDQLVLVVGESRYLDRRGHRQPER